MANRFADACIVGVGTSVQGRDLSHRTGFSLGLEALKNAAEDAGIGLDEIDGVNTITSGYPDSFTSQPQSHFWGRQLGNPVRWTPASFGIPAILDAAMAIDKGLASTVAVIVGQCRPKPGDGSTVDWARPDDPYTAWTGSYTAVQFALAAQRYIHEYGDGAIDAMATISSTIRNFGSNNPDAVYYKRGPFSPQDILDSRPIASPLTLLMCSTVNDGGAAIILTSKDRAKDTRKPIQILGGADQQPYPAYWDAPVLHYADDAGKFARDGFARAGVAPADMDLAAFYDHFAIGVLMQYELFGFCGEGEGAAFVKEQGVGLNDALPTCTDGGNHSFSHNGIPALFRPIEAVRQLRGEVKDECPGWADGNHSHGDGCRAVPNPELAFTSNPGPPTDGYSYMIVARDD